MICLNGQRLVGTRGMVARLVTRKFEEEVYVQTCLNGQTTWNSLLPKSQRLKMEVTIYTTHCSWLLANSVLPVPTVFCLLRGFSYKERNASPRGTQDSVELSIESVMPSNHFILCHPLLLLPSIFPSIRVCSNESALRIRWPKYWSFSFSISPSNEYSGLIYFRMYWLDLLAVQGTLRSLLHHRSSKAYISEFQNISRFEQNMR